MSIHLVQRFGRRVLVVLIGLYLFGSKQSAHAATLTRSWTSAVSGGWDQTANWRLGTPLARTNAVVGGSGWLVAVLNFSPLKKSVIAAPELPGGVLNGPRQRLSALTQTEIHPHE